MQVALYSRLHLGWITSFCWKKH